MGNDDITTIFGSFDLDPSSLSDGEKAAYWKGYNDYKNGIVSVINSSDKAYQAGYDRAKKENDQNKMNFHFTQM